jgi:hypothetical protein
MLRLLGIGEARLKDTQEMGRPLIFIGHSLGGIIIKQVRAPVPWKGTRLIMG